ncbi:hypothetical protein K491DRAFT_677267 [Lophiostoma macrostomum CBS 122681]|uniref:F-box domain-containing protein n=1 Tax=Lophiostoma macrostomum CBS 122681 TaxID=1314788 RepID=A0A6A6TCR9_9PLEO|nr:hypothetical protein K491DRAFT_677267 [Lophiostoma macrostomum CBS 122681]
MDVNPSDKPERVSSTDAEQFQLLSLPTELRLEIYRHVGIVHRVTYRPVGPFCWAKYISTTRIPSMYRSLLRVSKEVRNEVRAVVVEPTETSLPTCTHSEFLLYDFGRPRFGRHYYPLLASITIVNDWDRWFRNRRPDQVVQEVDKRTISVPTMHFQRLCRINPEPIEASTEMVEGLRTILQAIIRRQREHKKTHLRIMTWSRLTTGSIDARKFTGVCYLEELANLSACTHLAVTLLVPQGSEHVGYLEELRGYVEQKHGCSEISCEVATDAEMAFDAGIGMTQFYSPAQGCDMAYELAINAEIGFGLVRNAGWSFSVCSVHRGIASQGVSNIRSQPWDLSTET